MHSSVAPPRAEPAGSPISHAQAALYGAASIGTATFIATPQLLLLFFMTEILAAPAQVAGVAILAPKLIEMVMDPLLGALSDRTRGALGPRLPYMLLGALATPLGFMTVFAPPAAFHGTTAAIYVAVAFLLATVAYTLYAVPFVTLAGEISHGPNGRRRVVAWRMAFVAIGVLAAGGGVPALISLSGEPRAAYAAMSKIAAALIGVVFGLGIIGAWRRGRTVRAAAPVSIRQALQALLAARGYARLWVAYVAQMLAVSLNLALLPYAVKYLVGGSQAMVGQVFALAIGASLLAIPLWARFAQRHGDVTAYRLAVVMYASGFALYFACDASSGAGLWVAVACAGIAQGGQQLLPFALLPQAIEATSARLAGTGMMTGLWISGEKLALALGAAGAGIGLGIAGYVSTGAAALAQPSSAITALRWLLSVVPAAVCLMSLWALAGLENSISAKAANAQASSEA